MATTWSDVPLDLIHLLARSPRLGIDDLVRIGAVCISWRSILNESNWLGYGPRLEALSYVSTLHLPKLMMLGSEDDTRELFDLATGRTFQIPLPEATQRRICGSNDGWVVTIGEDIEVHLLNPMTRQQVRLPSQLSIQDFGRGQTNETLHGLFASRQELRDLFMEKAVIVGTPCTAGGCMVAAIVLLGDGHRVTVVRPGVDISWTVLMPFRSCLITDIAHHKGLLYGMSSGFIGLHVWDMSNNGNGTLQTMQIALMLAPSPYPMLDALDQFYLVEVLGQLVGVARMQFCSSKVFVYKAENDEWVQVKDLGDCCLFVGSNMSTVISPVTSPLRRNCIYFTDDYFDKHGVGVYNLDDGEYLPFYHRKLFKSTSLPAFWFTLNPSRSYI